MAIGRIRKLFKPGVDVVVIIFAVVKVGTGVGVVITRVTFCGDERMPLTAGVVTTMRVGEEAATVAAIPAPALPSPTTVAAPRSSRATLRCEDQLEVTPLPPLRSERGASSGKERREELVISSLL